MFHSSPLKSGRPTKTRNPKGDPVSSTLLVIDMADLSDQVITDPKNLPSEKTQPEDSDRQGMREDEEKVQEIPEEIPKEPPEEKPKVRSPSWAKPKDGFHYVSKYMNQ